MICSEWVLPWQHKPKWQEHGTRRRSWMIKRQSKAWEVSSFRSKQWYLNILRGWFSTKLSRKLINQSSYSFSHGKRNQQNLFTFLYFYPPQPVANPGGFLPPFTLLKKIQPEVKEKSFLSSFTLAHGRVPWALAEKVHLGHQSSPRNGQNKAKKRRQKQSSLIYSLAFFTLSLCNSLRQQW